MVGPAWYTKVETPSIERYFWGTAAAYARPDSSVNFTRRRGLRGLKLAKPHPDLGLYTVERDAMAAPCGTRELRIAREGLDAPRPRGSRARKGQRPACADVGEGVW